MAVSAAEILVAFSSGTGSLLSKIISDSKNGSGLPTDEQPKAINPDQKFKNCCSKIDIIVVKSKIHEFRSIFSYI